MFAVSTASTSTNMTVEEENSEMSHYICVASGYLALICHVLTDPKDVQLFICNSKCLHNSITL